MTWGVREMAPAPSGVASRVAGLRILVLDGAGGTVSVVSSLRESGAVVRCAGSADGALQAIDVWNPDVMLVDLAAAGDASDALIHRVRALPDHRAAIPAIALAAGAGTSERIAAVRAGYSVCVPMTIADDGLLLILSALGHPTSESAGPGLPESDGFDRETTPTRTRTLDIVVPLYNEEGGIPAFHRELMTVANALDRDLTIYYVDDGSTDGTARALAAIAAADPRVVVIELSRNFGHQAALSAGLDRARGDAVITLDGDGQHPPMLIPAMLERLESGSDVVLGQRIAQRQPSLVKRATSRAFSWVLARLSATRICPGCGDFRAMSRPVVDAIRQMPEGHRFVRGMVAWLGFRTAVLPYAERPRRAGASKYSIGKMLRLGSDAISSFSLVPLYAGLGLGMLFLLLALLEVSYVLGLWARGQYDRLAPGWSSLMFAVLTVGGFAMVAIGIIGSYVGYIFQEVKRRPVYVVRAVRRGAGRADGESR